MPLSPVRHCCCSPPGASWPCVPTAGRCTTTRRGPPSSTARPPAGAVSRPSSRRRPARLIRPDCFDPVRAPRFRWCSVGREGGNYVARRFALQADHDELAELGVPFRRYRAPVSTVSEVSYNGTCRLCHRDSAVLFGLRLNDYIIRPCTSCQAPLGLRLGWWDEPPVPTQCPRCGASNTWPADLPRDPLSVCYDCIGAGRVAIGHGTPLGHVDFAQTLRGMLDF